MSQTIATEQWTSHYFTVADGTKLHYAEMGAGPPVILIHGAGGSAIGNWFVNGIGPALAPTNRVIGIDMRGHGLSEAGPPDGRMKMSADVLEFMDQQGMAKAHIGGYSMGGFVTAGILATNPEKFITASFGGSGLRETDEWADKVPPDKEAADPEAAQATAAYQEAQRARGQEVGNGAAGAPAAGARTDAPRDPAEAARRMAAIANAIDLTKIDFAVLAVNGEFDRPLAKTHRLWREVSNFTNVVLPGKGHLSAVMAGFIPRQYIDAMVNFITTNNPS